MIISNEQLETGGKCYFKISYCTSVITNDTRILNVRIETKIPGTIYENVQELIITHLGKVCNLSVTISC